MFHQRRQGVLAVLNLNFTNGVKNDGFDAWIENMTVTQIIARGSSNKECRCQWTLVVYVVHVVRVMRVMHVMRAGGGRCRTRMMAAV